MPLLISKADVVAITTVEKNIDDQKLLAFVEQAQRRHVRQVLGNALYEELCDAVAAATDEAPLSQPMADLLERVKRPLAWFTLAEAWPFLLVHVAQAGLVFRAGRDSTSADYEAATATLSAVRDTAEFELAELKAWLQEHAADYPSYPATPITPAPSSLLGGVFFAS